MNPPFSRQTMGFLTPENVVLSKVPVAKRRRRPVYVFELSCVALEEIFDFTLELIRSIIAPRSKLYTPKNTKYTSFQSKPVLFSY